MLRKYRLILRDTGYPRGMRSSHLMVHIFLPSGKYEGRQPPAVEDRAEPQFRFLAALPRNAAPRG